MTFKLKYQLLEEAGEGGEGAGEGTGEGAGKDEGNEGTPDQTWPDNWRELYAGEDEKKLGRLQRYASPNAALDGLIAAQNRISAGELKTALPENPTEEELKTWRTENNIPESPDKYDLTFEDGFVIGDDDKPLIEGFTEMAHKANLMPDQVKEAIRWFYAEQEHQAEAQHDMDEEARKSSEDALRTEWGQDYRRNVNLVNGLLDTASEGLKDRFLGGRLSDGTPIGSDPEALKFLIDLALQINPITTLVPAGTGDVIGSIEDEIATIEKTMREDRKAYNRDEKMQERLRQLYEARDRHKAA